MRQYHGTLKILFYIGAMVVSFGLLLFILISSGSSQVEFFAVSILVWVLFAAFCGYKIYLVRRYRGVFRKGTLSIQDLDGMNGISFEELTCDILVANGFEIAENTQSSADFGVDVIAVREGISYAIQCKRYQQPVGIEAVQQVYAGRAYYECHVAVVLSNQYYTPAAKKLADKIGVVLWDRDELQELL